MEITFNCNKCGQTIEIDEACAGFVMKCVKCFHALTIPLSAGHQVESAAPVRPATETAIETPLERQSTSVLPKILVALLGLGLLAAGYFGYSHWRIQPTPAVAPRQPAPTITSTEAPKTEAQPPSPPAVPVPEEKKPVIPLQFLSAANAVMSEINGLNAADKASLDRAQYMKNIVALAAKVDDVLRVAEETGICDSNADARELCKTASAIFFDHNQALNKWDLELLKRAERDSFRSAHQAASQNAPDASSVQQSVDDVTDKLDQLTAEVMAALEARYDLWIDAQKRGEAAEAIVARLKMQ